MCLAVDGAARGNPGPAGAGARLVDLTGRVLGEHRLYLGETTNNVAEYAALALGLHQASRVGAREVRVQSDSELLVKQMCGEYRVKDPTLRVFHALIGTMRDAFRRCTIAHVPREHNRAADRLANRAVDDGLRAQTAARRPAAPGDPTQRTFSFPTS
ncbi:MAG: ribonuclease HI family protein [Candidatus Omnitrophica bacterium]|nr:ribonuclease HI family protein [Candidatus Omnitrophota bacterium]